MILISAGDAITAKLIEEAGFDGIWVSGFEVSTRMGLQDNGSITMTEMLNVCRPIVKAVKIPIYVDVDTGYGNFERTVREFQDIGISGLSIEDNMPDKENSLWGGKRPLMNMEEFGNKINIKHSLSIIARTEAIIRGYGQEEAFKRLKHYSECGADILLPHQRQGNPIQVHPGYTWAVVPTKFPQYTNKRLSELGYQMIIWANQTERVKIKAIRNALTKMREADCAYPVEKDLSVTLDDMKGLCTL